MAGQRIFATPFAKVHPMCGQKAERKNRTKDEGKAMDKILRQ